MKSKYSEIFLIGFACILGFSCSNPSSSENKKDDQNYVQEIFFPTTVGSEWVYSKTTTNTITSETVPSERIEYLYVELKNYDEGNYTYELSIKQYIKRIKYYGSPDGMSDLITYETIEYPIHLKNGYHVFEYKKTSGDNWKILLNSDYSESFTFSSFFVNTHSLSVNS